MGAIAGVRKLCPMFLLEMVRKQLEKRKRKGS
jgi:hypothetical protein